jgi:glycogen synthase
MLTWEYPPRIVGGLARHVYALSNELAKSGVSVQVLTVGSDSKEEDRTYGNLKVKRVNSDRIKSSNFVDWVYQFNATMTESVLSSVEKWTPHIIHAHDWLVAPAAIALKHFVSSPLLSTIHSTERGRAGRIQNDLQYHLHEVEADLCAESTKIIVASKYMKNEISSLFNLTRDKINVIFNGVYSRPFQADKSKDSNIARNRFADPSEKIILFVGRMFLQKGPQILLEAAGRILEMDSNFRFIFVGEGPIKQDLIELARKKYISSKIEFTGFIDDTRLRTLYHVADVAVFPSLYEPFGIVILEAMSEGCPVIGSNTGGLSEIIRDRRNGILVAPGDVDSLKQAILQILNDSSLRKNLRKNGLKEVRSKYEWNRIANRTLQLYGKIVNKSEV